MDDPVITTFLARISLVTVTSTYMSWDI